MAICHPILPFLLLPTLAFAGCQQMWPTPKEPTLGATATGEEIWVRTQEHQATFTEKKKVGEVVHKDDSGNSVGTSEVYEDKQRTVHWTTWYPMQGDLQLDDEDFLRIVGNEKALQEHRNYRKGGLSMNKWGKGLMIGGVATFVASLFVPAENFSLRYGLSTGGLIATSSGWYLARIGASRFSPEAHTIDPSRANYDIERYNNGLQAQVDQGTTQPTASLAIGRRF